MLYDTQGRYTELDNLTNSINNNAATTGICFVDNKLIAFFEDALKTDIDILKVYKLNQIKNIVIILTGVKGDIKFLMSLLVQICDSWNIQFQDVITAAYLSNTIADYIHSYTLRKNLRPLGGIILIADTISGEIYKVGVDSTFERSNMFVVGKNSRIIENKLKQLKEYNEENIESILGDIEIGKNLRIFKFNKSEYLDWYTPLI